MTVKIDDLTTDTVISEDDIKPLNGKRNLDELSTSVVKVIVKIDGRKIDLPVRGLQLKQSAFEHHELQLSLIPDLETIDISERFTKASNYKEYLGSSLVLEIKTDEEYLDQSYTLKFAGIVTNIFFNNNALKINEVILIAKSPTYKLDQERINKFWGVGVAESEKIQDTINQIISTVGLSSPNIEAFSGMHKYIMQCNESNWDFIKRQCYREGKWLFYDGEKIQITSSTDGSDIDLGWETNLGSFDIKLNTNYYDVHVKSWDYNKKTTVEGKTNGSSTDYGSTLLSAAFKASKDLNNHSTFALKTHGVTDQIKKNAEAISNSLLRNLSSALGQSNVPSITVGKRVKINYMGDFDGTYFVESVTHHVETGGEYYNQFTALPLGSAFPGWRETKIKMPEMQSAIVVDNKDPDALGRVKVKFYHPSSGSGDLESPWLRIVSPYAGKERGMYFLPEVDDEVLVGFEGGDIQEPVVLGMMWNGKDRMPHQIELTGDGTMEDVPNDTQGGDNNLLMIYTRSGNQIAISDKDGEEVIDIRNKDQNLISMTSKSGSVKMWIHTEGDLDISTTSNSTGETTITTGTLKIDAKDIALKASGSFKVDAGSIEMKSSSDFKVTANAGITMDAKGSGKFTALGMMDLQGNKLTVKGGPMVEITGALIKLN